MLGVDFGKSEIVKNILNNCLAQGLVLISTGGDGTVIRVIPALNIKKTEIDQALKVFKQALQNENVSLP
jgi:4-aminobutyrate aminotransferase-like enzyme